jgi:hypothetical protein
MTARHRRNRQKRIEKFVESSVSVGALIGLWIALSEDHPARHCTKREIREQTCMNQALQDAVMPYVTHAFTGALIGLLAAAAVVLGWKWLRDAQPRGRSSAARASPSACATTSGGATRAAHS